MSLQKRKKRITLQMNISALNLYNYSRKAKARRADLSFTTLNKFMTNNLKAILPVKTY